MKLDEMKNRVAKYTNLCVKSESGGESYFTKLDQYIKNDIELVTSYIDWIVEQTKCKNIIMSGELAEKVIKVFHQQFFWVKSENFRKFVFSINKNSYI